MKLCHRRRARRAALLVCGAASLPGASGDANAEDGAIVDAFVEALRRSRNPADIGVVLDVGANLGTFSARVMRRCQQEAPKQAVRLYMFEPQRQFGATLKALARKWNGEFLPKAAALSDGSVTFFQGANSEEASMVANLPNTTRARNGRAVNIRSTLVPSVDFANFLHRAVSQHRPPSSSGARLHMLLKLDIEGAEYELLPRLLARGALCLADYLIIDWHLKALPRERRMSGFGLRHALGLLHHEGCGGHVAVAHEEFRPLTHVGVPGLVDEAARHAALENETYLNRRSRFWLRGTARGDMPRYGMRWELSVDKMSRNARKTMRKNSEATRIETW